MSPAILVLAQFLSCQGPTYEPATDVCSQDMSAPRRGRIPPVPPSGVRRVYVDPLTGELSVLTSAGSTVSLEAAGGGGGAPTTAEYVTTQDDAALLADVFPGADHQVISTDSATSGSWKTLSNGAVAYSTIGHSFSQALISSLAASTSADLRGVLSDETGTGAAVFGITTTVSDEIPCGANQSIRRNGLDTLWECYTPSAGGAGNFAESSIALTSVGMFFQTTVTGQAWVTATSVITCSVLGTDADGLTAESIAVAAPRVTVANRVAGTGYDLMVTNPYGLEGTVRIHCTGG